jgi:hypothetical protein
VVGKYGGTVELSNHVIDSFMSEKNIKVVRYFLGIYFLIGGLISLWLVLSTFGVLGFLYNLIPATITTFVIFFFILSGYKYAFSSSQSGTTMMKISLLIQAVQLMLLGLSFRNYFGPFLAVGFTDTPEIEFQLLFEPLKSYFSNGFNKNSQEVSIVFNLVAAILLFLVYRVELAEAKSKADLKNIEIETNY